MTKTVSIEQELDRRGWSFFQTVGDSMEPLIHDRYTTVVIRKATERLLKNDVALYHRPGGTFPGQPKGRYVLHRVVKVREHDYLICGDNRMSREPVPPEWIIGIMSGYFNGDTYVSCDSEEYRDYIRTLWVRRFRLWWRSFPERMLRKLTR